MLEVKRIFAWCMSERGVWNGERLMDRSLTGWRWCQDLLDVETQYWRECFTLPLPSSCTVRRPATLASEAPFMQTREFRVAVRVETSKYNKDRFAISGLKGTGRGGVFSFSKARQQRTRLRDEWN